MPPATVAALLLPKLLTLDVAATILAANTADPAADPRAAEAALTAARAARSGVALAAVG